MLDLFFFDLLVTLGQAACAAFLIYGGFLVLMPAQKAPAPKPKLDDMRLMHLRTHA